MIRHLGGTKKIQLPLSYGQETFVDFMETSVPLRGFWLYLHSNREILKRDGHISDNGRRSLTQASFRRLQKP